MEKVFSAFIYFCKKEKKSARANLTISSFNGVVSLSISKKQGRLCTYTWCFQIICFMDLIKLKILHEEISEILIIKIKDGLVA